MAQANIVSAHIGEAEENVLTKNETIIRELIDITNVSNGLVERQIMDNDDSKRILSGRTDKEKIRNLIGTLLMRGPDAYPSFISILRSSNNDKHTQLADILENERGLHRVEEKLVQRSYQKTIDGMLQDHAKRIRALEADFSAFRNREEVQKYEEELRTTRDKVESLKEEYEKTKTLLQDSETEKASLMKRIGELEARIESLEKQLERMRKLEQDNLDLRNRMDAVEAENKEFKETLQFLVKRNSSRSPMVPKNRFQPRNPEATGTTTRQVTSRKRSMPPGSTKKPV